MKSFMDLFDDCTSQGTKIKTDEYLENGKYAIVDQGQNDIAGYTNIEDGVYENIPAIIFGDHTRAIKYINTPFFLGADGVKLLKAKDVEANYKYLYYALRNAKIPNTGYNRHYKWLKEVRIEYPNKEKQKEVVEILDKIELIMNNRKQQLHQFDTLIKARFVEIFGDMWNPNCIYYRCELIETCKKSDDIKCGPFGTQLNKDEYQENGVAVWEIPQINSGFAVKPIHYLTKEKAEFLKEYSLIPGDIAMSRKGNVGQCGLFPDKYSPGIIHSDVLRIRVDNNRVNPYFMMCQLHFSSDVRYQIAMVSSGAVMAGINVTKLKHIKVYLPDIELQNQFAEFVKATDKSKAAIQKSLDETQLLFDSLMQKYFG